MMIDKKQIDSIIFDLDGTLWDSTPEVSIAFNKVLQEKYPEITDEVNPQKLGKLFGLPLDVIAVKLFQSVGEEHAKRVIEDCCTYECEYIAKHGAALYDGLQEVLQKLSVRYKLFIVSNCQEGYIQCFFQANPQLEPYFTDYEYPGRTGKSKADNIRMVIERNGLKHPVYVGDTQGDLKAARESEVPFIYAGYGLGEAKEYDEVIDSLKDLVKLLD